MESIPLNGLEKIAQQSHISNRLISLSLDQALKKFRQYLAKKQAYYVGPSGDKDYALFGLEGNANLILVPMDVYNAIGSPSEGESVPVALILEKAGMNYRA